MDRILTARSSGRAVRFWARPLCPSTATAAFDEALRIATEIGATPLALEVLVGLALRHSAGNNDVHMQVELFIDRIAGLLAPERMTAALERGGALLLEDVVAAQIRGEAGENR